MILKFIKKAVVFIGTAIIVVFLGMLFGFEIGSLNTNGRFVPWTNVKSPPETPARILMIDRDQIWVRTVKGNIFHIALYDQCSSNCWIMTSQVPSKLTDGSEGQSVKLGSCVSPPPVYDIVDQKGECEETGLYSRSWVYAIKSDGQMIAWIAYNGTDESGKVVLVDVIGGTLWGVCLAIPLAVFLTKKFG